MLCTYKSSLLGSSFRTDGILLKRVASDFNCIQQNLILSNTKVLEMAIYDAVPPHNSTLKRSRFLSALGLTEYHYD